jgi:hypothetical protein
VTRFCFAPILVTLAWHGKSGRIRFDDGDCVVKSGREWALVCEWRVSGKWGSFDSAVLEFPRFWGSEGQSGLRIRRHAGPQ